MSRCLFFFLSLLACLGQVGLSRSYAKVQVRLKVWEDRPQISVRGEQVRLFDGDVGDVLARIDDHQLVRIQADPEGLLISGVRLRPRSVRILFESSIQIEKRWLIGEVWVANQPRGLLVVNYLELERYLEGLLGAEMSKAWPAEALKAQAVAARTFFLYKRLDRQDARYDLEASTLDQVYRGIGRESKSTRLAVQRTKGEVLTWGKLPAQTLFHSCCAGRTHNASDVFPHAVPYLIAVADPYCKACPKYRWQVVLSLAEVLRTLKTQPAYSGPVSQVVLKGDALVFKGPGAVHWQLKNTQFRRLIGADKIYSSYFTSLIQHGDRLILSGQGSGHGVGMCQWGARGMALAGNTYKEILNHYYPGCTLRKFY